MSTHDASQNAPETTPAVNAASTARTIANRIEAAVLAWQPEHREDDLAILVLQAAPR